MAIEHVIYTAAHGGFAGQAVPLGGGAAVVNLLEQEWARTRPFELTVLGPAILGAAAPGARDLVSFSERQYAAFCDAFRHAATEAVLRHDPRSTAVLVNDISEGPDFARIAAAGFRVVTVYHVDVVAYIAAIYLRERVRPATLTRLWERLRALGLDRFAPQILRLIFAQQRASLAHSAAVVVPSAGMRTTLEQCYPGTPEGRIHVVGWGAPEPASDPGDARRLRSEFGLEDNARVLLCLSRISPEKGQDTLLEALLEWEHRGDLADTPLWLFICGEPAFMQGASHMARLRQLAARLKRIRVVFPGYASGQRKCDFFALADLYVFPSRHESYGLTLMEALAAGLPAVAFEQQGSRDILRPEFGSLLPARAGAPALSAEIARLLSDPARLRSMGAAARHFAGQHRFSRAADHLVGLLKRNGG